MKASRQVGQETKKRLDSRGAFVRELNYRFESCERFEWDLFFRSFFLAIVGLGVAVAFSAVFSFHFFVALFHRCLAAQLDSAFVIDFEALDPNFIANLDDVFCAFHTEVGELADVAESVLSGEDFHETTKLFH